MKIEEGKYYLTQDGRKFGPMKPSGFDEGPWIVVRGDGQCWDDYGLGIAGTDSPDLVAEWSDDETPTLWRDMTPEEKGALLLAKHEGKTIQRYCEHRQEWVDSSIHCGEHHTYRIKPEPKRKTVTLHGCGFHWEQSEKSCPSDTHRITFDTIDGEPDCSSIKMEKL